MMLTLPQCLNGWMFSQIRYTDTADSRVPFNFRLSMFSSPPKTHHETRKTCPVWKVKHILIETPRFFWFPKMFGFGSSNQPTAWISTLELAGELSLDLLKVYTVIEK